MLESGVKFSCCCCCRNVLIIYSCSRYLLLFECLYTGERERESVCFMLLIYFFCWKFAVQNVHIVLVLSVSFIYVLSVCSSPFIVRYLFNICSMKQCSRHKHTHSQQSLAAGTACLNTLWTCFVEESITDLYWWLQWPLFQWLKINCDYLEQKA